MTELYLNGVKVALKPGEVVATTVQANDLAKPDKVQSSYTNTFKVVATAEVRAALGNADSLNSDSEIPYTTLDAQLLSDGREILPFGLAEIENYSETERVFDVSVFSGNVAFFDALADKSIRDLDLSAFNHTWDFHNISQNTGNRQNFVYDLIDRGHYLNLNAVNCWDMFPSVFGKLIFEKIISEAGFTYTGMDSELLNRLLIPAIEPFSYSQDFIDAHTTFAGTTAGERNKIADFEERAFFNTDSDFEFSDGAANCFNPVTGVYTAPAVMLVNIEARAMARIGCIGGKVHLKLKIVHNGNEIAADHQAFAGSLIWPKQARGTTYNAAATNVYLAVGDTLEIRWEFWGESTVVNGILAAPRCEISYNTNYTSDGIDNVGKDFFRVTPQKGLPKGGIISLTDVLPDIKQSEFIKFILQLHNGLVQSDLFGNRVRFAEFRSIETNTAAALDWSDKFVRETGLNYKFGDFGQNNHIRYKEDSTVKSGYGDGVILCGNKNLPKDQTIISFPFAASESSAEFPQLAKVPIFKTGVNGAAGEAQNISARVLLQGTEIVNYRLTQAVESGFLVDGVTYEINGYRKVTYRGFDFYEGQNFVANSGDREFTAEGKGQISELDLGTRVSSPIAYFDRPGSGVSLHAQKLVNTYYPALAGILDQTKYLTALFRLDAADAEQYDATVPIWISRYGHYFYLNKINAYQSGKLTEVELIRL